MRIVRLADVQPSPWRNGGGSTRELLAWPDSTDWDWRLSVAEVAADGPFSRFDGVTRWFAVLHGEGVRLDIAGQVHVLTSGSPPLCFDGGLATGCALIAGKFALEGWAEATAYEVAPFGVHVTLVEPGNVRSDFTANRRAVAAHPGPYGQRFHRAIGVMERDERGGADPRQVAEAVARVLSDEDPRRRVVVGNATERMGLVAKRVLPHRWFETVARRSLGVD